MALALYRKYRPRTFAEVIGQEHVTEPLSQALRSGRLHHAYLFSGPRGCGKTSSARILARSLNCEQGPTPEPCGACGSCKSLANDGTGSIDVIEIDAASHGGVDDARELREKAFFAPANSRYKIYVIDEAHMVSSAGFNALLKLVEEPPDYVKFIFATTEPEKVLGTIRSRTHHYPFRLIPPAVLRPYLQQLTEAEGAHVDPAVFPLVVRAGGGSARDTLSVLDQLIAGAGPEGVGYARAVALLGVTDAALIDEMCDALAAGDGAAAYQTIDRVAEAGHDPRRFASDLLERFRDLIVLQQVPDAVTKGLIDGPADQLDQMGAQATRLGPATLSRCADIVHNGLVEMRGTTAPRLLLELITARMLLPGADNSSGALLQRLERMERRLTLTSDHDSVRPEHPSPPAATSSGAAGAPAGSGGLSAARAAAAAASRRAPGPGGAGGAEPEPSGPATASASASASGYASGLASGSASAESSPEPASVVAPVSAAPSPDRTHAAPSPEPTLAASSAASSPEPTLAASSTGSTLVASSSEPASPLASASPVPSPAPPAGASEIAIDAPAPSSDAVVPTPSTDTGSAASAIAAPVPVSPAPEPRRAEPAGIMPDAPDEPSAVEAVPGQLSAASIREVWPEIMVAVGRKSKKIAALAQGATVRDLEGQTVVLTFRFPAHARMVAAEPQLISDALYEALGGRWQIRCDVAGEGGQGSGGRPAPRGPQGGGGPAPRGPQDSGPGQPRPAPDEAVEQRTPAQARTGSGASSRQTATAPQSSADEEDDGGWPEPVKPGGLAAPEVSPAADSSAAPPAHDEDEDESWPEPVQPGHIGNAEVPAAEPSAEIARRPAVPEARAVPRNDAPGAATDSGAGGAGSVNVGIGAVVAGSTSDNAPSPGIAAARAAAARGAAPAGIRPGSQTAASGAADRSGAAGGASGGVAVRPGSAGGAAGRPGSASGAAGGAAVRPGSAGGAAARPGSAGGAAARPGGAGGRPGSQAGPNGGPANGEGAWSDGSPTEEAPYDPDYDGPIRGADGSSFEGFDPGDEPLDDVIDEKTARQSSEQQAVRLLQEAFGAEKISES
ncbi:DNA polymerase III subunit gamma and tau [Actinoplanes sp. NPDC051475]|uniref:DNA polymerase III subunit gamma and tau n=1 Tax=Actinoplanes sp. NPDC051475 TaxID=3157225 RepID=UPI00344E07F8